MDQLTDSYQEILHRLRNLEERIARIEEHLELAPTAQPNAPPTGEEIQPRPEREDFEIELGQNWFAKLGIVLLAIGFAFALTFPYKGLPAAAPGLAGYLLVAGVVLLSQVCKQNLPLISRYLVGAALALLYFTTLRLYFFGSAPVLHAGTWFGAALLSVIPIFNLMISLRRGSPYLAAASLLTACATAIVVNRPYFVFAALTLLSATIVYLGYRYSWKQLLLPGIFFTYLTHLIWALNDPLLGREIQLQMAPQVNLLFVLLYAVIFAAAGWRNWKDNEPIEITATFLNGMGAFVLFLILTIPLPAGQFAAYHIAVSAVFLVLAIGYWMRHQSKYSTFLYAMLGYFALTLALARQFPAPNVFIWLSLQSFLVVATAIYFCSRYIVVANFFIYLGILIAYLVTTGTAHLASLIMGFIALASARILNWQQHRLALKTETMRNAYLASAFFIFPYALYNSLPRQYVALSWIGVAILYYVLNRIIKRQKYLWMGHLTLAITVLYILIIGIVQMSPGYRIVSFLALGLVLLAISIIYTRRRARSV